MVGFINTLRCLGEYIEENGVEGAIGNYTEIRQEFYEGLSTFDTFGRGWTRRNKETETEAYKMAGNISSFLTNAICLI